MAPGAERTAPTRLWGSSGVEALFESSECRLSCVFGLGFDVFDDGGDQGCFGEFFGRDVFGFDEDFQGLGRGAGQDVGAGKVDEVASLSFSGHMRGAADAGSSVEGLLAVAEFHGDGDGVHHDVGWAELGAVVVMVATERGGQFARGVDAVVGAAGVGIAG